MTSSAHPSDIDFGIGGSDLRRTFWLDELFATMPRFADALCAEVDFAIFFPDKGGSSLPAKTICGACPEQVRCLAWALESDERFGIYGGLTARERWRMTRRKGVLTSATNAANKGILVSTTKTQPGPLLGRGGTGLLDGTPSQQEHRP